ncbi:MAG: M48 family metallopeptidase [Pseudomarimonas sp.]
MTSKSPIHRERITLAMADGREVEVERVRDPRARRIKLLVGERGVRLTVPRGASNGEALAFLIAQREWLDCHLQRISKALPEQAESLQRDFTSSIMLRGESIPLTWQPGRYAHVRAEDDALVLVLPPAAPERTARRVLREFLLAEARADVGRWLPTYLPGLPRPPRELRIRPLRSLWGSLSPDNGLSLDLSLVLGPPAAFEYVLVHELCHLLQRNHSPAFWREVTQRLPQWRTQRAYLRGEGMALKQRLAALIGEVRQLPPA